MYLTQKNHIRTNKNTYKALRILSRLSKNLYNHTLYTINKQYEFNGTFLRYESTYHQIKDNENYKLLPSQVAQQTMKIVNGTFKSFFGLLKKSRQGKYLKTIKKPSYLAREGYFVCVFSKDMFKIEENQIRLSMGREFTQKHGIRYLYFTIPKLIRSKQIKEVRILPQCNGLYFEIEYVYLKEQEKVELDKNSFLGIDLGLDNFATCVSTSGTSFILEGRGIKSFNRWWNKKKAKIQSIYKKQGIKKGKKQCQLYKKRKHIMNEYMNKNVHFIIQYCLDHKIGNVVIGKLKEIKQGINLGRKNNQNFVNIPYNLFKRKLESKCKLYGIKYIETGEEYTSQKCSNCGVICKSNRKYRGLYVCKSCGMVLNADVNGAINILHKVASGALHGKAGGSGVVNTPIRIKTIKLKKSLVDVLRVYKTTQHKEGNNSKIKFLKTLENQRFSMPRNLKVSRALSVREG
ncbi:MAG: RNA-guided endonuclease InsQ/TnpB family protein [Methanobacterium sp.]